jgi:hypothetical protein
MSTQIQRRRGTTAEHSTFTGVEGELTVDTTKDTAVVHDGTTVGGHPLQKQYPPLGSAAAPTYTFTGDTNTGIYSPGADQVAVATNGDERMRIDSSGNLGLGTASPTDTGGYGRALDIQSNAGAAIYLRTGLVGIGTNNPGSRLEIGGDPSYDARVTFNRAPVASNDNVIGELFFQNNADSVALIAVKRESAADDAYIQFATQQTGGGLSERARITSAGRVGIGTSSPSSRRIGLGTSSTGNWIQSSQPGVAGVAYPLLLNPLGGSVGIGTTSPANPLHIRNDSGTAQIKLDYLGNSSSIFGTSDLFLQPNGATAMTLKSGGNVGIGTTTVSAKLHIAGATGGGVAGIWDTAAGGARIEYKDNGTRRGFLNWDTNSLLLAVDSANSIKFSTNAGVTQHATIDSSGRLLVGTSSAPTSGQGQYSKLVVQGNSSGSGAGYFAIQRTSASTLIDDVEGVLSFNDNSGNTFAQIICATDATPGTGDYPGRLVFSTTADGASTPTERMRITNRGSLQIKSDAGIDTVYLATPTGAGTSVAILRGSHSASSGYVGTDCIYIYANGNVVNTNNSYGAISDIKLKENIVDANSQWDDLKALQVRNYNFKEGQTHTQIGLVAQEVELVSPGLVSESPDRDEDGNDLGTVTKSVNYSVLYMKAVKALQEAMERIETLEGMVAVNNITIDEQQHQLSTLAARLTALESA